MRQLSEQVAAARDAVYDAENSRRTFADQLPGLADQLSRATDRDRRTDLEAMIRNIEAEQSRYENELQPARNRESELSRALAVEEDRWEDLLTRLQRLTQ